jgi:hypothetical protein
MVRIGGGEFPEIKERDYIGDGSYRVDNKVTKVREHSCRPSLAVTGHNNRAAAVGVSRAYYMLKAGHADVTLGSAACQYNGCQQLLHVLYTIRKSVILWRFTVKCSLLQLACITFVMCGARHIA